MVLDRSEFALRTRRQNAHGWAGNKSVASFGTKLVLCRCNKEVHRQRSTRMYNCLTVYFKRLTENVFSKAVAVCASTSCCTKRIGTGFIYHSCSTFQFLIVRVASSNPCQTMSVRGHCLTSSFCSRKNVATAWNHRPPWRIGAGFIYHSCSFFQFLIVRVASSNPAPISTIFFPSALCCSA